MKIRHNFTNHFQFHQCFSYEAAKKQIEEVLDEATDSLLLLDDGGFKLNLVKVEKFSSSPFYFEIG